ncbi:MAG: hypothetical protein QNJ31_05820 [Candidatus Caenarcaniphilales bacterium]|nr:hypothetical protein [Candidatus Caenarcaniphilales bacterium]
MNDNQRYEIIPVVSGEKQNVILVLKLDRVNGRSWVFKKDQWVEVPYSNDLS